MTAKERYSTAHFEYCKVHYPNVIKDGLYSFPGMPKINTSNGLTNAISNYLKWIGGIGNRINTVGRLVEKTEKTFHGETITAGKRYIKGTTIKGTADLTCLLPNGKTIYLEIKTGKDMPRPAQLAMQQRVRNSNGVYEFVHSLEDFFYILDMNMGNPI